MGAATFPKDGEDFDELLHWARARVAGAARLARCAGSTSTTSTRPPSGSSPTCSSPTPRASRRARPSARLAADRELFAAAQREAAREIARDPRARGLLYVGVRGGLAAAPLRAALPPGDAAARAGDAHRPRLPARPARRRAPRAPPHPLVTEVYLDGDQRFAGHEFLLFLSEHSAYGAPRRPGGRMFHTSDVPLVDALVSKLQTLYDLQPL